MKIPIYLAVYLAIDVIAGVAIWRWVTVPMVARVVAAISALHGGH